MNTCTTTEGEPETSKPRQRPKGLLEISEAPVRMQDDSAHPQLCVGRLLRHKLTSPEKRTVKRVQAQRVLWFADVSRPEPAAMRARVLAMLRDDRGLKAGLEDADAYEVLTTWLVDEALATRTAAEVLGMFLREVGAMERPGLSAPRVKAALRVLNEVLYGPDQSPAIPHGIREFRLEKRDGGLQIVGVLRTGAEELAVRKACTQALSVVGYSDVDVRLISHK